MRLIVLMGLIVTPFAAAACGGGAPSVPTPAVTRTVDVDSLTFADVQERARGAATKPGEIFHVTDTHKPADGRDVVETWLDAERHVARVDFDGNVYRIFGAEKMAMLDPSNGRYLEAGFSWLQLDTPFGAFSLDYLARLTGSRSKNTGIDPAVIDGAPAIAVSMQQPAQTIDGPGRTEKARIFFDESFLPLKMDLDLGAGAEGKTTHVLRAGYIARASVPADFFSLEYVRANAKTATDNVRDAAQGFARVYWLGEGFESVELQSAMTSTVSPTLSIPVLRITYDRADARAQESDASSPCFSLTEYTRDGWEAIARAYPPLPETWNRIERATQQVLDGDARIFEVPADRPLTPPNTAGPERTPPPISPSSSWTAEIMFPEMAVELRVDCGHSGKNPYQTLAGVQRLLGALQVLYMGSGG